MKIGIISDIHGNFIALKKVYGKIKNCHLIFNAGDLTGYYPDVNHVIDVVMKKKIISIIGNHDRYLLEKKFPKYLNVAKKPFEYSVKTITSANKNYLRKRLTGMELEVEGLKIGIYHGSPFDADEYIFPDSEFHRFNKLDFDILILGHTHWPMVKKVGKMMIINPGSVGQPRDYNSKSSYAIFDTTKKVVQINQVCYNIDIVCSKLKKMKFDPRLCQMLKKEKK